MEALKQRILKEGKSYSGDILKVDGFINHQIDPELMYQIAREFERRFSDVAYDKIITVEASGIAPAVMLGLLLTKKPVIYVKKRLPFTMEDVLTTTVHSFTKNRDYPLSLSRQFIQPDDKFIFIDDFLAYGHAALGIIDLLSQAKAKLVGVGIVIEKGFQNGGTILREQKNIRVESLAIIKAIEENKIIFSD